MLEPLHGATPGSNGLPDAALQAVRSALGQLVVTADERRALSDAVSALAHTARAHRLPPERLLVCFKALWVAEAATHAIADQRTQAKLLEQMISLCIEQYFAA